jgi:CRP-like cAMP-binding protein
MAIGPSPSAGPNLRTISLWAPDNPLGVRHQLLNEEQKARIAKIASVVRFKKGDQIYLRGDAAEAAFNLISGVVATFLNSDHVTAFLYNGDVFGLSEEGRYTNSAKATTSVTAYKIPIHALRRLLSADPDLDVHIISKLCEELRQAQRHAFILAQQHAVARVAMFLELQEHLQAARGEPNSEIFLLMDRSAIAEFVGLSFAAVSRAFRTLVTQKVILLRDRRHVRVADRPALERLADEQSVGNAPRHQPRRPTIAT